MGNRANVVFHNPKTGKISPGVYLHWNGGPESVYAFLDELDRRNVRADQEYEVARFVHIVADFFDSDAAGSLSLGVFEGPPEISPSGLSTMNTDLADNGVYVVTRNVPGLGRVVRRFHEVNWSKEGGSVIKEVSREEVEAERKAAYRHPNMGKKEGIPATFLKLRPKIAEHS